MPILTLTTDWGLRDHYLAAFKGELLSLLPTLQLIDISNEVEKYNTMQAAYIVQNCFQKFPAGTIHFISVSGNENCKSKKPFVIVHSGDQYLLGEDNGIFSLILGEKEKEIIRLPLTFHSERNKLYSVYRETICSLATGTDFKTLGTPDQSLEESYFVQPMIEKDSIRGSIIYIDSFGNVVVNITREVFEQARRERLFSLNLRRSTYLVSEICLTYEDVEVGELVAFFNKENFLEIAINKDSASKLLGLKIMDSIKIDFNDNPAG